MYSSLNGPIYGAHRHIKKDANLFFPCPSRDSAQLVRLLCRCQAPLPRLPRRRSSPSKSALWLTPAVVLLLHRRPQLRPWRHSSPRRRPPHAARWCVQPARHLCSLLPLHFTSSLSISNSSLPNRPSSSWIEFELLLPHVRHGWWQERERDEEDDRGVLKGRRGCLGRRPRRRHRGLGRRIRSRRRQPEREQQRQRERDGEEIIFCFLWTVHKAMVDFSCGLPYGRSHNVSASP